MPLTHILFDLDGTLTDSQQGIIRCIHHALTRLDRPLPPAEKLQWCIGPPLIQSFTTLLETNDHQLAAQAVQYYRQRYQEIGRSENRVYDGVRHMLTQLKDAGYVLIIATSKPLVYTEKIVDHFDLNNYFHAVYGSGLDGALHDKRDLVRHILSQENVSADQVVMIGDSRFDIIGAHANQVKMIAVTYGYGNINDIQQLEPETIVHTPLQIPDAVFELDQIRSNGDSIK